jgi:hypothetical protein
MIKPNSIARSITRLRTLFGLSQDRDIYSRISFVVSTENGQPPRSLPEQWTYLEQQGSKKYVFERTENDTRRILAEILQE